MAALTWKNVNTPAFSGIAALGKVGLDSMRNATSTLAEAFNNRDTRLNEQATNNAIARAAQEGRLDLDAAGRAAFANSLGSRVNQAKAMEALNAEQKFRQAMRAGNQAHELGALNITGKEFEVDNQGRVLESKLANEAARTGLVGQQTATSKTRQQILQGEHDWKVEDRNLTKLAKEQADAMYGHIQEVADTFRHDPARVQQAISNYIARPDINLEPDVVAAVRKRYDESIAPLASQATRIEDERAAQKAATTHENKLAEIEAQGKQRILAQEARGNANKKNYSPKIANRLASLDKVKNANDKWYKDDSDEFDAMLHGSLLRTQNPAIQNEIINLFERFASENNSISDADDLLGAVDALVGKATGKKSTDGMDYLEWKRQRDAAAAGEASLKSGATSAPIPGGPPLPASIWNNPNSFWTRQMPGT